MLRTSGITVLEMLIVVAILGILGTIGIWRVQEPSSMAYSNDVRSLVQRARFEAVNRNRAVTVRWQEDAARFAAVLGSPSDVCGGSEIIVGRSVNEYRQVSVAFDPEPTPLVWLPNGQARGCDLRPYPGTIATVSSPDTRAYEVTVTLTGRVEVQ